MDKRGRETKSIVTSFTGGCPLPVGIVAKSLINITRSGGGLLLYWS